MTQTELDLLILATFWNAKYDDSNPDVGFGPAIETLIIDNAKRAGISLSVVKNNFQIIIPEVSRMLGPKSSFVKK